MLVTVAISADVCVSPKPTQFLPLNHSFPSLPPQPLTQQGWLESLGVQGPVLGAEGSPSGKGSLGPHPQGAHQ